MVLKLKLGLILMISVFSIFACTKEEVEYTIVFNTMGGEPVDPIVAGYLDPITLPIPQRDGYIFVGWYNDASYTGEIELYAMVDMDFILYAKWEPQS